MSGRRGPVVLHVPRDVFAAEVEAPTPGPVHVARAGPRRPSSSPPSRHMLAEARRRSSSRGAG